ncbi:MAG: hypothetical protein U0T81_06150 [Saprospiraceae bacterium]
MKSLKSYICASTQSYNMMKMYTYLLASLLSSFSLVGQNQFWQKDIEVNNANLRTPKSVVLGELEVDAPRMDS